MHHPATRLFALICIAALGLSASAAIPALAAPAPAATPAATAPQPARDRFVPNQPVPGAGAPATASRAPARTPLQPYLSDDPTDAALRTLQSQVMRLQNHLQAVESTLEQTPTGRTLTWRCNDASTSINNLGITDRCDPFGCDGQTGRCREVAVMNGQCANGAMWDGNIGCVYPDRRGPM